MCVHTSIEERVSSYVPKKKDMAPCLLGEPSGDRVQKICTGVGATDMEEFPLPQRCCVPGKYRKEAVCGT